MAESLITANQLSKIYNRGPQQIPALVSATLRVAPGEFVALMGRSGSGKSTLLSILGGLERPTNGQVLIAGTDLQTLRRKAAAVFRRQHIGFLFQAVDLLPTLTVQENVMLPAALNGTRLADCAEEATDLLQAVGVAHLADALPDQLSGGERQRVGIARALINKPPLVLADEPTGSLDQAAGERVVALLQSVARQQQSAIVLATHDRSVAQQADRILTMTDGLLDSGCFEEA